MLYPRAKFVLDKILCIGLLSILMVPMFIVALVVVVSSGWPFIFCQQRIGYMNKPFKIYKFRTMRINAGLVDDSSYITPIGHFLRRWSLDEMPQVFNVLLGDMSFVGPRPLPMEYLSLMPQNVTRRHSVRPGITGLAQIKGRNGLSWRQKFRFDCWYVDHVKLSLDVYIMLQTPFAAFFGNDVVRSDDKTMPLYKGEQ